MRWLVLTCVFACGGDGGTAKDASSTDGPPRDAAIDAPPDAPTAVRRVDPCPANPAATVTTASFKWTPASVSIARNDIVKFMPESNHRAVPHTTKPTDFGINSGPTGQERCLQFTEAGTFNYQCGVHPVAMEGVVQVN